MILNSKLLGKFETKNINSELHKRFEELIPAVEIWEATFVGTACSRLNDFKYNDLIAEWGIATKLQEGLQKPQSIEHFATLANLLPQFVGEQARKSAGQAAGGFDPVPEMAQILLKSECIKL